MDKSCFISPDNEKWQSILERAAHDFYHLPGYVDLEADWHHSNPLAFVFEEGNHAMLLPLIERPLPVGTGTDAVSPYGYSGPVFTYGVTDQFRVKALQSYQDSARQRGILSTFIRLHPFLETTFKGMEKIQGGTWVLRNRGFVVDMPLDLEREVWLSNVAKGHRADIRRLMNNGTVFVMNSFQVEEEFPRLYEHTMRRLDANMAYRYTPKYFTGLKRVLGDRLHYAAALDSQGKIMATGIFTKIDDMVQYHLSATDPRFNKFAPMKFIISCMREWSRKEGVRYFNLGGGLTNVDDPLFQFKVRFDGYKRDFYTVEIIHDQEKYKQEVIKNESRNDFNFDSHSNFFPKYRRPDNQIKSVKNKNLMILTAGRRVTLVQAFKEELVRRKLSTKVFCADMFPDLSSACAIADKKIKLPHVLSPDYISTLIDICQKENIFIIVPTTDTELLLLSKHRNKLLDRGIYPLISDESLVQQCRNKRLTPNLAKQLGVEAPKEYDRVNLKFPCFVKPSDGSSSIGARLIINASELSEGDLTNDNLIFMEYFDRSFEEYTVDVYFDRHGRLRCLVPRLRIEVRAGEVSKGVTRRNRLYDFLSQNLENLPGARGCLTFQFFYNPHTGRTVLIEVNPRFGGGFPLAYSAGANYPGWIVDEYILDQELNFYDEWESDLLMLRYDAEVLVHGFM